MSRSHVLPAYPPMRSRAGAHHRRPAHRPARPARRRRRRGGAVAFVILLLAVGLVGWDLTRSRDAQTATAEPLPFPTAAASAAAAPSPTILKIGAGTFAYARGAGATVGRGGPEQTYRVAVEDGVAVAPDVFATTVDTILGDARGWTAGGALRLRRVPGDAAATFTIYLATPVTSQAICRSDGMETDQFTSCRLHDNRVVINSERWLTAIPDYGAPLAVYQAYAVNHEVGHQLGHGHELCPAPGAPAPVMQQQTLGLQGCVANGWPYVNGARYEGPPTDT
jgi:Protein of unknown function (DUF3152)